MRKSKYLVLIGVLILILPIFINFVNLKDDSYSISLADDNQPALEIDSKKPKSSGSLDHRELWIDDSGASGNGTWADIALAYPAWCTWTGSEYVLEDITLTNPDGTGSTLLIANSSVNFIIENCSLSNSEQSDSHAGINLINASNGKIFNCTFSNNQVGIRLFDYSGDDSNNIEIINNTITNCEYGVYLYYAEGCLLENNTIEGGSRGVVGVTSHSFTLRNNTIKDCSEYGIWISSADQAILSKNTMKNCGVLHVSGSLPALRNSKIYLNNTVNGKPIYYYVDEVGLNENNFTHSGQPGQILLANCSDSDISGFNVSDASVGIGIQFSENNTISSNIVNNNGYYGIFLERYCYNNTIFNNTVNANRCGIFLSYYCHENNITNNKLKYNDYGMQILRSDYCNITHNVCTENYYGTYIYISENCIVFNNTITDNNFHGIWLNRCHNTTVAENNITGSAVFGGNYAGIGLEQSNSSTIRDNFINFNNENGIYATDSYRNNITNNEFHNNTNMGIYFDANCDDNIIYLNSFINNALHAFDDGNNYWNYSIGNYWDNYTGSDPDGDGIGNTPHPIPGGGGGEDKKPIVPVGSGGAPAGLIPAAADDDDDDDDAGVVVVVVVVVVICCVGAGIGVIYVLMQKGIIGTPKKR